MQQAYKHFLHSLDNKCFPFLKGKKGSCSLVGKGNTMLSSQDQNKLEKYNPSLSSSSKLYPYGTKVQSCLN